MSGQAPLAAFTDSTSEADEIISDQTRCIAVRIDSQSLRRCKNDAPTGTETCHEHDNPEHTINDEGLSLVNFLLRRTSAVQCAARQTDGERCPNGAGLNGVCGIHTGATDRVTRPPTELDPHAVKTALTTTPSPEETTQNDEETGPLFTAPTQISPIYANEVPFASNELERLKTDVGLSTGIEVTPPDDAIGTTLPCDPLQARRIDLAERILGRGGAVTGYSHHTSVTRSICNWYHDDNGTFLPSAPSWLESPETAFRPAEIRIATLKGDLDDIIAKAETVLAWAAESIEQTVLKETEQNQFEAMRDRWEKAVAEAKADIERDRLRQDPPKEVEGWEWYNTEDPAVTVAYRGVYRDEEVFAILAAEHDRLVIVNQDVAASADSPLSEVPADCHIPAQETVRGLVRYLRDHPSEF
ncbi:hypothetical protein RYH80_18195 [Halobaculum sp. MBLA0147]|uniref:hypothetical protein n=1 Tax=Halobaculum sp. MBLA0147 TaxID=3079934 RepID=UPI003523D8B5